MRKTLTVATLIIATLFMAVSCQKKPSQTNDTGKVNMPSSVYKITTDTIFASEDHNAITLKVIELWGDDPTSDLLVSAERYVTAWNILKDDNLDVTETAQILVNHGYTTGMLDSGYHVATGIKSISTAIINYMPASSLKTAFSNINSNTDTGSLFFGYVSTQLSGLTGLSGNESIIRFGYDDIIRGSYALQETFGKPAGKTEKQIKESNARIAQADSDGWTDGFNLGIFLGMTPANAIVLAKINSAWDSSIQRDIESGVCPVCHHPH